MVETQPSATKPTMANSAGPNGPSPQKRGPPLHQIYALPAPVRTFPLPTFYPNNPVSLFHIACAWLSQTVRPPPAEPAIIHQGTWSAETTSVHITDEKSVRALWEQGFYGKGSLSRSEPNWLRREQVRRGLEESHVSEILTVQRREERLRAKWERARLEQEAIRQTRETEAKEAERLRLAQTAAPAPAQDHWSSASAPVGPSELLALPNSAADLSPKSKANGSIPGPQANGILPEISDPGGDTLVMDGDYGSPSNDLSYSDELRQGPAETEYSEGLGSPLLGHRESPGTGTDTPAPNDPSSRTIPGLHRLVQEKSVRFSPKVESTTFEVSDPPNPSQFTTNGENPDVAMLDQKPTATIVNREHLQLMPEEALWLSFGLGALAVTDQVSGQKLSSRQLLTLFRQHCYFPPRTGPDDPDLQPDDEFLVHYAVYHHFRSLGWVPRAGIKFGVDWLLYTKGPVFDHAEFGLVVVPSYSHPWWQKSGKRNPRKTWQWLHSIVRVLSHVMKSLVLVYVDVPPPSSFDEGLEKGFAEALKLYRVREIMVKRWSPNRNR